MATDTTHTHTHTHSRAQFLAKLNKGKTVTVHGTKAYGEAGGKIQLHSFFTSAPDEGEWSASRTGRFTIGKQTLTPTKLDAGWAPEPGWTF